jgi:HSP20 family protein
VAKRESEKEKKDENYYLVERFYGSFSRSFTMPSGVDAGAVKAELKDGVLTMTVPKKPEGGGVAPQKVVVNADTPKPAAKA